MSLYFLASSLCFTARMRYTRKDTLRDNKSKLEKNQPPPKVERKFTSDPSDCLDPVYTSGAGSIKAVTTNEIFANTVLKHGDKIAMASKKKLKDGTFSDWNYITYETYWSECRNFALSMIALDIQSHAVINILGFNSAEWLIANNGSILANAIPAGIYSTNSSEMCHYISNHCKANLILCDSNEQLRKYERYFSACSVESVDTAFSSYLDVGAAMYNSKSGESMAYNTLVPFPHLKAFVLWGDEDIDEELRKNITEKAGVPIYTWKEFMAIGSCGDTDALSGKLEKRIAATKPGHCASLIYTSGTTGPPKAVMLSHDNIAWTCRVFADYYVVEGSLPGRKVVSYLPLSHVAAQMIDIFYTLYSGSTTYFAQPDALKGSLSTTLKEVRPTVFFGVPRVWEKMEDKLKEMGKANQGLKKVIGDWCKARATAHCQLAQYGHAGGEPWGYGVANGLVLKKIKEALGFDECKGFFTAAAPISVDTLNYFASLDIPVYELFGQSECTGPHTSSKRGAWKIGCCGRPLPGTHSKIDPVTGELAYKGRHIFMGYMYMEEQTRSVFDSEGYMRSGDMAAFDLDEMDEYEVCPPSGFMRITGRIKDLIITAGGENIPPVLLEESVKLETPVVSNCVVIGDKRKFLTMLITLKCNVDSVSGLPTNQLTPQCVEVGQSFGSDARTIEEASSDSKWSTYIERCLKRVNAKSISNATIIQKYTILNVDFCERNDELTPTLKLKRRVIEDKYKTLIDAMYN